MSTETSHKPSKAIYWWIGILLFIMLLSNPGLEAHRQAYIEQNYQRNFFISVISPPAFRGLFMDRQNFIFFSTTTIGGKLTTVGVFGMVIVL